MSAPAWQFSHSVDADIDRESAWTFWTNVNNWVDPPATFEIDGPFAEGSTGRTMIPGNDPLPWVVRDVHPPSTATVAMQLAACEMLFKWQFDSLPDGRTRLTQEASLVGDGAQAYIAQAEGALRSNLPQGMARVASAMEASKGA